MGKQKKNTMQTKLLLFFTFIILLYSCNNKNQEGMLKENKAIFLHHSTGNDIWKGGVSKYSYKLFKEGDVQKEIKKYNKNNKTNYSIVEQVFPKKEPYGWNNYPFDYYNIWVKNAGNNPFMEEPTLEMLTKEYGLIIWKHCFPVSSVLEDTGNLDINSEEKRLENYKLQYNALKRKMHEFPNTKFLVWTGAALVREATKEENAKRMKEFVDWVKNEWNETGDNIFLWDFYELETEGSLYLKDEYAYSSSDSHPNKNFASKTSEYFVNRIFDIFLGKADKTKITGKE